MASTSPIRFGGWSGILAASLWIAAALLAFLLGRPPTDTEELLRHLSELTTPWSVIVTIAVLADLLLLPFAYALYRALRDRSANLALGGCGLLAVFAILDLSVRWPNWAALVTLAGPWPDATLTEIEALIVAGGHATALLQSFLLSMYVILVPGIGVTLIGIAWYRAEMGGLVAYAGMAVGAFAVLTLLAGVYVSSPVLLQSLASIAVALWAALAGFALLRVQSVISPSATIAG